MHIAVHNLSVSYEDKQVLQDFSMEFPKCGVVTLFGPSGCGKSTLLDALSGLVDIEAGSISGIEGLAISRVFQENRLLPWCDSLTNVAAVIDPVVLNRISADITLVNALFNSQNLDRTSDVIAEAALRFVGLGSEIHRFPNELSGGMQKRLGLARALAFDGDVILLDEPTVGIDEESAFDLLDRMVPLWKDRLVVLVTHDEPLAQRYSDQIIHVTGIPLTIVA